MKDFCVTRSSAVMFFFGPFGAWSSGTPSATASSQLSISAADSAATEKIRWVVTSSKEKDLQWFQVMDEDLKEKQTKTNKGPSTNLLFFPGAALRMPLQRPRSMTPSGLVDFSSLKYFTLDSGRGALWEEATRNKIWGNLTFQDKEPPFPTFVSPTTFFKISFFR